MCHDLLMLRKTQSATKWITETRKDRAEVDINIQQPTMTQVRKYMHNRVIIG